MSVVRDADARTLTITAHFDAPIERVWQVWSDPRQLERWWGPPTYPATVTEHELAPGGSVAYAMTSPEGTRHPGWWRVRAVDPPHRLEFENGFADADGNPSPGAPTAEIRVALSEPAGHADSTARVAARHLTPSVQRILGRFDDVPVIVIDPAWTIVAANPMARALLADDVVGQNAARSQFIGPQWVERDAEHQAQFERELVDDLHLQLARHPDDTALHALVAELRASSQRFSTLWADPPAAASSGSRKTFRHPAVGTITVDCDHLEVVGSDLRIVIWTAAPGSSDAGALALLGVVGSKRFDA